EGSMDLRYVMLPIYGSIYEWKAQIIGSCVSSGGFRATVLRILCEIVLLGDLEEMLGADFDGPDNLAPFAPYNYRAGRKFAGINGNSDGSMCGPHVRGMQEYGILKCSATGLEDYTDGYPECSGGTYRKWGANDRWLEEFADQGRAIRLKESERVETASRVVELIRDHFKPMMICSGVGLAPAKKHRDGFWIYKASGSWSHNMTLVAVRVDSKGNVFIGVWNSWGPNAHRDGSIMWVPIELMEWWVNRANIQSIGEIDLLDSQITEIDSLLIEIDELKNG